MEGNMSKDYLTSQIICAAINVHRELGPGLLESVYESCLSAELDYQGVQFRSQVPVAIKYRNEIIASGLRLDLLVDDWIVVELKSVDKILPIHKAQLLSYLKLTGKRVGLLINFNVELLKDGIVRFVR